MYEQLSTVVNNVCIVALVMHLSVMDSKFENERASTIGMNVAVGKSNVVPIYISKRHRSDSVDIRNFQKVTNVK